MEYNSKESEIMLLTGKWMELEIITLGEISQSQKTKYHISHIVESRPKMMLIDYDDDNEDINNET
jgi:hypothetical protein